MMCAAPESGLGTGWRPCVIAFESLRAVRSGLVDRSAVIVAFQDVIFLEPIPGLYRLSGDEHAIYPCGDGGVGGAGGFWVWWRCSW